MEKQQKVKKLTECSSKFMFNVCLNMEQGHITPTFD